MSWHRGQDKIVEDGVKLKLHDNGAKIAIFLVKRTCSDREKISKRF